MKPKTLQCILELKGIKAAELARRAGVSRQSISKWFQDAERANQGSSQSLPNDSVNIEWNTLRKITDTLELKPTQLSTDLFQSLTLNMRIHYKTLLLWDSSYSSIESFTIALLKKEYKAVGRYIQVFGILAAEKIFGKWVYKKFESYSPYIHPVRRKELGTLCKKFQELKLI